MNDEMCYGTLTVLGQAGVKMCFESGSGNERILFIFLLLDTFVFVLRSVLSGDGTRALLSGVYVILCMNGYPHKRERIVCGFTGHVVNSIQEFFISRSYFHVCTQHSSA